MKTNTPLLAATLLLTLSFSPARLRGDDAKPAEQPKTEQPKPETPKESPKPDEKKDEKKEEKPAGEEKKDGGKPPRSSSPKPAVPKSSSSRRSEEEKEQEKKDTTAQEKYGRETAEIMKSWEPALTDARRATVQLTRDGKAVAFGCAVHENGYILTKASEVQDKKGVLLSGIEARFSDGLRLPVKLADFHRPYDLALLKVEARGLRPMVWDETCEPCAGSFLAAATPERIPAAAGVVSVCPRCLDDTQKGFLGVNLDKAGDGLVKITMVSPGSPAAKAGLVLDDVVKSIDGKPVSDVDALIRTIGSVRPYQTVKIVVKRDKEEKELTATLDHRPAGLSALAEDPRNTLSGTLSKNRRGYPDALQHDMVLEPNEVGGPVVDLDGHVVGMNIARSGRIECYAIPSHAIKALLAKVGEGKLFHPELDSLRDERKNAEAVLDRLKKEIDTLNHRIQEAEVPLDAAEEKK